MGGKTGAWVALRTNQECLRGQGVLGLALATTEDLCLPVQVKQPSELTFVSLALAVPRRSKQNPGHAAEALPKWQG